MGAPRENHIHDVRLACVVPGCRRTRKPMCEPDEEWICDKHFATIPQPLRQEYDDAWHAADRAEKALRPGEEISDFAPYIRVTEAFERCKTAVGALQ